MNDKVLKKCYNKNDFVKLVSNLEIREKIQGFPELVYGDDNEQFGVAKYELMFLSFVIPGKSYMFTISYQGIKTEKIDTIIYSGPSSNLEKIVDEIVEKLKDVDY